jgi:hypothetical protein
MRSQFHGRRSGKGVYKEPTCSISIQQLNAAINIVLEKRLNRYVKRLKDKTKVDDREVITSFRHRNVA